MPASVSVRPADTDELDPNDGGWFAFSLEPGESGATGAIITNVRGVPVDVDLYMADLSIAADGTPVVSEPPYSGVGSWATTSVPRITVPPSSSVEVQLEVTVPLDVEPGDHLGVFVAESHEVSGDLDVVFRVATRFYVSVPGSVVRDFEIDAVEVRPAPLAWPRRAEVEVTLRNTGQGRVAPVVRAAGHELAGSRALLVASVESYRGSVDVPWYGGPIEISVVAVDGDLVRESVERLWVVPWGLLAVLLVIITALAIASVARRDRRWRAQHAEDEDATEPDVVSV